MDQNTFHKKKRHKPYAISPIAIIAFLLVALQLSGWILYIIIDRVEQASETCNFIPSLLISFAISTIYAVIYSYFSERGKSDYPKGLFFAAIWICSSVLLVFIYYKASIPNGETPLSAAKSLSDVARYLLKLPLFSLLNTFLPILLSNIADMFVPAIEPTVYKRTQEERVKQDHQKVKPVRKKEKSGRLHTRTNQEYVGRRTAMLESTDSHASVKQAAPAVVRETIPAPPVKRQTEEKKRVRTVAAIQESVQRNKTEAIKKSITPKEGYIHENRTVKPAHGKREAPANTGRKKKKKKPAGKKKSAYHKQRKAKRRKKNKKK